MGLTRAFGHLASRLKVTACPELSMAILRPGKRASACGKIRVPSCVLQTKSVSVWSLADLT